MDSHLLPHAICIQHRLTHNYSPKETSSHVPMYEQSTSAFTSTPQKKHKQSVQRDHREHEQRNTSHIFTSFFPPKQQYIVAYSWNCTSETCSKCNFLLQLIQHF